MDLRELIAALDAGERGFALEQRVRADDPRLADQLVVHREAIAKDGARALLQRLHLPVGALWLDPLVDAPIVGQPIWGHEAGLAWLRAEGDLLVTRGKDGRLRRFSFDGVCHEDREATARDDARRLGEVLVELDGWTVRLRDPETGELRATRELDRGDGYCWLEAAELLDDGTVAQKLGEDHLIYGPQYRWVRLDPRTGQTSPMAEPDRTVRVAGRLAVPQPDGSVRLVDRVTDLAPARAHDRPVLAVALAPDRMVSGALDSVCIHDRDGRLLARARDVQAGMAQIVIAADRIVTCSAYQRTTAPCAVIRDPATGEPRLRIAAGGRYQELMSCDPTGARLAYTVDGVLHLREIDEPEAKPVRLTWHWARRVAWSADGARLAIQHTASAPTVWSLETGARERILTTDVLDSATIAVSEGGDLVLVDHSFYALHAFALRDGAPVRPLEPGINVTAIAAAGTKGVCGGVTGGYWFDLTTNTRVQHVEADWMRACSVREGLAAIAGDGSVTAIAVATGERLWTWACPGRRQFAVAVVAGAVVCIDDKGLLTTLLDGQVVHQARPFGAVEGTGALAGLDDGTVLLGGPDGVLRRIDPRSGIQVLERPLGGRVTRLSAGGGRVCVVTHDGQRSHPSLQTLAAGQPIPLPAGCLATQLLLTPDGQRLVALDRVARLDVLDARTAERLDTRPFGAWPPADVPEWAGLELRARRPAGEHELVAALAPGGELRVMRGQTEVARWVEPRRWSCVALDGDRLVAGDLDGHVGLWAVRSG